MCIGEVTKVDTTREVSHAAIVHSVYSVTDLVTRQVANNARATFQQSRIILQTKTSLIQDKYQHYEWIKVKSVLWGKRIKDKDDKAIGWDELYTIKIKVNKQIVEEGQLINAEDNQVVGEWIEREEIEGVEIIGVGI